MNEYLLKGDAELVDITFKDLPVPEHQTNEWRKVLRQVQKNRRTWAKKVEDLTALRIIGWSDGQWVRRVNREQLERLAARLGLDAAGKIALAAGDPVAGFSLEDLTKMGVAIKAEVEQEYLTRLTTSSVRAYVLSLHKTDEAGKVVSKEYEGSERTAQRNLPRELGRFWKWAKQLRTTRKGQSPRRSLGQLLPGLSVNVVDLTGQAGKAPVSALVLNGRELARIGGLARVESIFTRIANYIGVLSRKNIPSGDFEEAEKFFDVLGLTLTTAGLRGTLRKDWPSSLLSWLSGVEEFIPEHEAILVVGVRRLFERAGLFINPTCREDKSGLVQSTGLIDRAAYMARTQLLVREVRRSSLIPEGYEESRLDAMWTKRKTGTVYRSVVRPQLPRTARDFWEAEKSAQSTSLVMTETLGDVRLASLLDGAAAGYLRRFMETQASAGLKAAVDPSAPGALAPAALAPVETWKELRRAIFDARMWAAHELFYGGEWMGLSPDYRRRLRLALDKFFSFMTEDHDVTAACPSALVQTDSFFGDEPHTQLGESLPYDFRHRVGKMNHGVALMAEGVDLVPGDFPLTYWTDKRVALKHLPVMRTVSRLISAGRNRVSRALMLAVYLKAGGTLPDILRPVVPIDGPEPLSYLASLEASGGVGLSRLFDMPGADIPAAQAASAQLLKMKPEEFDLSFFDPRAADMAKYVSVGALRAQWEWARRQPCLIGLGGFFWYQELNLLRLGLGRAYPEK